MHRPNLQLCKHHAGPSDVFDRGWAEISDWWWWLCCIGNDGTVFVRGFDLQGSQHNTFNVGAGKRALFACLAIRLRKSMWRTFCGKRGSIPAHPS